MWGYGVGAVSNGGKTEDRYRCKTEDRRLEKTLRSLLVLLFLWSSVFCLMVFCLLALAGEVDGPGLGKAALAVGFVGVGEFGGDKAEELEPVGGQIRTEG